MHKVDLKKSSPALKFANFFGVFGYLFATLTWLWVIGLSIYPLIISGRLSFLTPAQNTGPRPLSITPVDVPQSVSLTIGIVTTIVCVGLMIYALYALPKTIGKTSSKVAHNAARAIVPVVIQGQKISKNKRKLLTFQITAGIKVTAAILPVLIGFLVPNFEALAKDIVLAVALILSAFALFNFGTQLLIARAAKLSTDQVW